MDSTQSLRNSKSFSITLRSTAQSSFIIRHLIDNKDSFCGIRLSRAMPNSSHIISYYITWEIWMYHIDINLIYFISTWGPMLVWLEESSISIRCNLSPVDLISSSSYPTFRFKVWVKSNEPGIIGDTLIEADWTNESYCSFSVWFRFILIEAYPRICWIKKS